MHFINFNFSSKVLFLYLLLFNKSGQSVIGGLNAFARRHCHYHGALLRFLDAMKKEVL